MACNLNCSLKLLTKFGVLDEEPCECVDSANPDSVQWSYDTWACMLICDFVDNSAGTKNETACICASGFVWESSNYSCVAASPWSHKNE